jgi:DNA-binding response OmpR family regulator/putative methionine-R-sulfoxide reductase with GAF domain
VVDHERFYRDAISEVLDSVGIACEAVSDGDAAIEAVERRDFAVVVLELGLDGRSSLEVLARIRVLAPSIGVILLAVQSEQDSVLEGLRLGALDYLAKPLHDEELILAARRALAAHATGASAATLRERVCALDARVAELNDRANACAPADLVAELGPRIAEAVSVVLGARKASLLLLDEAGESLSVVGASGHDVALDAMDASAPGEGVAGLVVSAGEPIVVDDLANDERLAGRGRPDRYATNSLVVTPVSGGDGPLGVLCATDREDGQAFGAVDVALLRVLAAQVGQLLRMPPEGRTKARPAPDGFEDTGHDITQPLPYDVPDRAEEAELARAICDVLTYEIEPERVIAAVLEVIARLLPASPVALYLIDNRTGTLELEGQVASDGPVDREQLDRAEGLTGTVLQTGNLVATDHPDKDPRFAPDADTPADGSIRPLVCVPMQMRGKALGVLRAFPLADGAAQPRTAEILAAATSAAVRNVLLYRSLLDSIDEVARARREGRR